MSPKNTTKGNIKTTKSSSHSTPEGQDHKTTNGLTKDEFIQQQTLNLYISQVDSANQRVYDFIKQVIDETSRAYHAITYLSIVSYSIFSLTVLTGLYLVIFQPLKQELYLIKIICVLIGLIGLIYIQSENPIGKFRQLTSDLTKLNVLFAAYTRQLHQIDFLTKNLFSWEKGITIQELEQCLTIVQDLVDEALDNIAQISNKSIG